MSGIPVIKIHGIIGSPEDENDTQKYFGVNDINSELSKIDSNSKTVILDFDSPGGNVSAAYDIAEILNNSGKNFISQNTGDVASAASYLFCIANDRNFNPSKGVFLPHNPWGELKGDAEVLASASNMLKNIELDYEDFYSKKTGTDKKTISEIMAKDTPLSPDEIVKYGFAKIAKQPTQKFKAIATINLTNKKMTVNQEKELKTFFEKITDGFDSVFSKFNPKSLMIADASGNELEFPDAKDASEIIVGSKVNLKGAPFSGESIQSDGSKIIAKNGIVSEIIPPTQSNEQKMQAEIDSLNSQLEAKTKETTEANAKFEELKASMETSKKEIEAFKAKFSAFSAETKSNPPAGAETKTQKTAKEIFNQFIN